MQQVFPRHPHELSCQVPAQEKTQAFSSFLSETQKRKSGFRLFREANSWSFCSSGTTIAFLLAHFHGEETGDLQEDESSTITIPINLDNANVKQYTIIPSLPADNEDRKEHYKMTFWFSMRNIYVHVLSTMW